MSSWVLYRHIAEALKAGQKVEPESHEMVTIVFSDIKGFTDISREISPMKVSMMLDRLYLAIDEIAKKHQVFKVETVSLCRMTGEVFTVCGSGDSFPRLPRFFRLAMHGWG